MIRSTLMLAAAVLACAQEHWPAQLETDVKTENWDAAVRVGSALVEEIEAGRMFARFQSRAAEIQARELYATALDHAGKTTEANRQRALAKSLADPDSPGNSRRLRNLKTDLLAEQIDLPAHFPSSDRVQIVAFWADWCVLCKPELEQLAHYSHPRAKILTLDADHLDPALREYGQPTLPQLYIVDSAGHIRFHIAGFEDDHLFQRKLDWMVEAALDEPQR